METKITGLCRKTQILLAGLLVAGVTFPAAAQQLTPQSLRNDQLEWRSDDLNLSFKYPADLVRRDPTEAIKDEHLMVYGVPGGQTRELADATHCLKPLLALELPTSGGSITKQETKNPDGSITVKLIPALLGTVLLTELDITCMTPEQQIMAKDIPTRLVEVLGKVPGMHQVLAPSMYLIEKQPVHMAAAQGQPLSPDDTPLDPLLSYTLGFSTSWNNHLLVWYFSSNNAEMMNRMTKSTVKFGSADAETLYPLNIRMEKQKKH